ncbi:hypothetical protein DCS_05520 [Drechmeria coniospora]|uniref:Uncharacterized protein n=1 Tax=Drechmeria coniospora TaxID=98403 RepID=A0A151GN05_DRECN|nr:hypothetical protein DCS_05520 [Drechmeria coniospora]KYK58504.1 hypothetical protein DCS_05520 [Drechmeria coniospora]
MQHVGAVGIAFLLGQDNTSALPRMIAGCDNGNKPTLHSADIIGVLPGFGSDLLAAIVSSAWESTGAESAPATRRDARVKAERASRESILLLRQPMVVVGLGRERGCGEPATSVRDVVRAAAIPVDVGTRFEHGRASGGMNGRIVCPSLCSSSSKPAKVVPFNDAVEPDSDHIPQWSHHLRRPTVADSRPGRIPIEPAWPESWTSARHGTGDG